VIAMERATAAAVARPWIEIGRPQLRAGVLLGLALLAACSAPVERESFAPARIQRGAVVSEHPLATAAGVEVLELGGNAADAAVATALALAVVYPQAGNLGGGGFALWASYGEDPVALDFREVAPRRSRPELYLDDEGEFVDARSITGPLAVGVPGSPEGLYRLYEERGSGLVSWERLVAPAIALARDGFEVDPWLEGTLGSPSIAGRMNVAGRERFYPLGAPLRAGQLLVQADLARTLEAYSEEGPAAFYGGWIAEALVRAIETEQIPGAGIALDGALDLDDLAAYRVVWREPLRGRFQGKELIAMPPPSSGGIVVLQTLSVLDGLPLGGEVLAARETGLRGGVTATLAHWWIEALRAAFADRATHMGDPDYYDVPMEELLSAEWILQRRVAIGPRANLDVAAWAQTPPPESPQTTHLSVIDVDGNAVSLTTTLNSSFGSGILVRDAGFFLNNELDDFSIAAGVPNQYGLVGSQANALLAGKRPLSSMSPMIVRDDRGAVVLVLGSPGGPRIITAVIQVLLRVLLLEEDLHDAVRAPRLHQQWRPLETWFESTQGGGWDAALLDELAARGQPIEIVERQIGSVQAIAVDELGNPIATSDPRRGGAAGVTGRGVQSPAPAPDRN